MGFCVWGFGSLQQRKIESLSDENLVSVVKLPSSWEFCGVWLCSISQKRKKEKGFGSLNPQLVQFNVNAKASQLSSSSTSKIRA